MPVLKNLTLTALPTRRHDPVAIRRAKLIERLEDQKRLLAEPNYVRTVQRWTGKGDQRRQVDKQQKVRPWWRLDGSGHVVFALYHGAKPARHGRHWIRTMFTGGRGHRHSRRTAPRLA